MLEALTRIVSSASRLSSRIVPAATSAVLWRSLMTTIPYNMPKKPKPSYIDPDCPYNRDIIRARFEHLSDHQVSANVDLAASGYKRTDLTNSADIMHGGALASLHDIAACKLLHGMGYKGATTALAVAFEKPASIGSDVDVIISTRAEILTLESEGAIVKSIAYRKAGDKEIKIGEAMLTFKIWK